MHFLKTRSISQEMNPVVSRKSIPPTGFQKRLRFNVLGSVKLPPRSPNLNAYAERFVRTIKEDCLEQTIFFGEDSLRNAVREYIAHYHGERNHQGLGNRLISPTRGITTQTGRIQRRQRLGGMLNYYYRDAA